MAKKKPGTSKKKSDKPEFDVVVIGTGMGGSAAGAIAASHGLKTLILEKNPRIGGSCSYYEKQGFHMDTGTHLFIRGNKGPFGVCTERLGMGKPIDFVHPLVCTRVRGLNASLSILRGKLGMMAAAPMLAWQLKIPVSQYPIVLKMFFDIATMSEEKIQALDTVTIEDFIARYTDHNLLKAMLGFLLGLFFILPTWEASAGESLWNMQKFLNEANLCYPRGGAVTIPRTFLEGAKKHGAKVRVKAGVKKIEIANGQVQAVILTNGERITTRTVISTSSLGDTILKFAGPEHFSNSYIKTIENIKGSMIAVQVKIAVKKRLVRAGSVVGGSPIRYEKELDKEVMEKAYGNVENGIMPEFVPVYAPVPTNYDPTLAPDGCQIITACAVAPTTDIELKDPNEVWIKGLMDALYEMIPGLEENIIFYDAWSVKKIANWIGKSTGAAVTTGQTIDQVGSKRPGHQLPVKGLYAAGDCAGPARGVGTELACQSGMDCGDLVARDLKSE